MQPRATAWYTHRAAVSVQMVRDDVAEGTHTGSSSVTKGLLWLKRWVPGKCKRQARCMMGWWCVGVHWGGGE